MLPYVTNRIAENFYSIEQDFVRCFLIAGKTEALLVDTGFGNGNLKGQVEEITKLPVTVVFTHADGDHTGNAGQFDTRYMHPSEFDYYRSKNEHTLPMIPVWEGESFQVGSYHFEVLLIPGHTPGSIALLEKEKRFLIGGDSVQTGNIYMFGAGRNFEAYRGSLKKLEKRRNDFDLVYASHDQVCVKADLIPLLYETAGKIMEKKLEGSPVSLFGNDVKLYKSKGVAFYAV